MPDSAPTWPSPSTPMSSFPCSPRCPAGSDLQHLSELEQERAGDDGFGDEGELGLLDAVVDDGVAGVAGHEEHLHFGSPGHEAFPELAAAHDGHHHVAEQHVDHAAMSL